MSKKSFKIFLGIFFILLFFVVGLFLIIQLNVFPDLTKTYNECIAKIFLENQNPNIENFVPVQKDKIILESDFVDFDNLNISFVPLKSFEKELNDFSTKYDVEGIEFVLLNNNSVIQATGILKRFSNDYDVNLPEVETWTFENEYPIITSLGFYQNCIVFIDAVLQVHFIDIFTGESILNSENKIYSPVYPSGKTFSNKNSFIFEGKNQKLFSLNFSDLENLELQTYKINNEVDFSIFEISEEAKTHIKDYISNWLSLENDFDLPEVQIIPSELNAIPLPDDDLIVFVYCPSWSGIKTVGLCNENSEWIKSYTFISIFTDSGEMLSVSMDYVADKPQLELHHSSTDTNFYYIVIGKLSHNDDTEKRFFTIK